MCKKQANILIINKDGKVDFANLDLDRCKEYEVNKGKLYGLRAYAKALKRYISLSVWYPIEGRKDKWQLYFSTDDSWMDAKSWIITGQDSNWNFVLEMASSMRESPIVSRQTSENCNFTSMHHSLLST